MTDIIAEAAAAIRPQVGSQAETIARTVINSFLMNVERQVRPSTGTHYLDEFIAPQNFLLTPTEDVELILAPTPEPEANNAVQVGAITVNNPSTLENVGVQKAQLLKLAGFSAATIKEAAKVEPPAPKLTAYQQVLADSMAGEHYTLSFEQIQIIDWLVKELNAIWFPDQLSVDLNQPIADTDVDSLDLVELVMMFEEEFDTETPDDMFDGVNIHKIRWIDFVNVLVHFTNQ